LKRALASGLIQIDGVHPLDKPGTIDVNVEQPVQPMDPVPCYRVVPSYQPGAEVRNTHVLVVEENLTMNKKTDQLVGSVFHKETLECREEKVIRTCNSASAEDASATLNL
jgi:hypothetical protein